MQSKTKKKGFTIVELVIVIAVIGILTAVLVPTFTGLVQKAQEAAKQENMRNAMLQFQADAADGYIGESGDVALPQNVQEDQLQMTLDGVSYVYNKESGSWNAGKFVAVSPEDAATAGTPYARRAYTPLANLGPNDIAYNGEKYKLMYVGANFKGYSEYSNCLVQFLAKISDYQEFIDNAADDDAEYFLATVAQNEHYADYLYNSTVSSARDDGFKITARPFLVGDDNAYEFKPRIVMIDADGNPAPESAWDKEFDVTVEVKEAGNFVEADPSLYSLPGTLTIDNLKIDFADEAVDHTFRITTKPSVSSGLSASRIAKFTQSLVVDVVDGFNVYRALDLAYIDDTPNGVKLSKSPGAGPAYDTKTSHWVDFKATKGLDTNYHPEKLIFQDDIAITTSDFPATDFTFQPGEDNAGTLINDSAIYRIFTERDVVVEGNYFQLDASAIPLVHVGVGEASTAALFQPGDHSSTQLFCSLTFKNLNITGNSKYATSAADDAYAGGYCFLKGHYSATLLGMENCIARSCFQTVQSEYRVAHNTTKEMSSSQATAQYIEAVIDDCKFSDNYNVFIYNYGGHVTSHRSTFRKCGGPIIMQDHVYYEKWWVENPEIKYYDPTDVTKPYPWVPEATFIDCDLNNYVVGTEPWFIQWNVNALVTMKLKPMSKIVTTFSGLSYLLDPTTHQAVTPGSGNEVMNFVALNKATSLTASATNVCGKVTITSSAKTECFNYGGEDSTGRTRTAIQQLNTLKPPVMQRANNYAILLPLETDPSIGLFKELDVDTDEKLEALPAQLAGGGAAWTSVGSESEWTTEHTSHGGLYFNGMLMVLGLAEYHP